MGRKPKYINPDQTIEAFYASVSDAYNSPGEGEQGRDGKKKQELLEEEFGISRIKVRKILITTGDLSYPQTAQIQTALDAGNTIKEISAEMGISPSTANSLLPYSKGVYGLDVSAAADRTAIYRSRKAAVEGLKDAVKCGDWSLELWKAICLFAGYPFSTAGRGGKGGIRFRYSVSKPGSAGGRHYEGETVDGYGNEMWIDGKEKSISRSTVERTFQTALENEITGPKALMYLAHILICIRSLCVSG